MIRKLEKDGSLLCELQANTFETSIDKTSCSSEIFIRRFMKSDIAKRFDDETILDTGIQDDEILYQIEAQYGKSTYGTVKYTKNEMHWIGYLYRYFSYTHYMSSSQVYKLVKPKELRGLYLPYHTLDVSQAIERILEAKNIRTDEESELLRQYEIFRAIRKS